MANISTVALWAFDESQLKNFTTFGALVPIAVGLIIFKFAVSAVVRSIVLIVALALGGLVYSQRSEISDCVDNAQANIESSLGKVQCRVLGFDLDLDLQDQVP
jgi:large-conductance mechanosensitive channel